MLEENFLWKKIYSHAVLESFPQLIRLRVRVRVCLGPLFTEIKLIRFRTDGRKKNNFWYSQESNVESIERMRKANETLYDYQSMNNTNISTSNNTNKLTKKRSTEGQDENFFK